MREKQKVLIVDDERFNINVLVDLLKNDYKIIVAKSGIQALKAATTQSPDLILLDIMMPDMDGFEVCRRLKQDENLKNIPVLFISAMNDTLDKVKGFEVGGIDYITKPIEPEEVKSRVKTHMELVAQRQKTEELLANILPYKVITDLKETGVSKPDLFKNVTVLFSDFVNFTAFSTTISPEILINELSDIFTAFDDIIDKHHCERIKTIGDAYLAVCGMPDEDPDHAKNIVKAAIEITEYLKQRNSQSPYTWEARIGVHSGPVVGGIVGVKKYLYDIFGDTVNTASRVETASEALKVTISQATRELLTDNFNFTPRDLVDLKGKEKMNLYFVN